ncbi:hypothetical protein IAT40_007273 [Kwoniella sp. CBS 6097]
MMMMGSHFTTSPMHWQTFTTQVPITPQLEEAFRRQAAAAFAMSPQSMGYSVTSSMSSRNGITTSHTSLQIGKATPWTAAEIDMVERYLVGLFPPGHLLGPSGRPVGLIEQPSHSHSSTHSHHSHKHGPPSVISIPSTVSEAGTVPPSKPPRGIMKRSKHQIQTQAQAQHAQPIALSPTSPTTSVDVQRHESHQQGSGNGNGMFKSITQRFSKKTTIG